MTVCEIVIKKNRKQHSSRNNRAGDLPNDRYHALTHTMRFYFLIKAQNTILYLSYLIHFMRNYLNSLLLSIRANSWYARWWPKVGGPRASLLSRTLWWSSRIRHRDHTVLVTVPNSWWFSVPFQWVYLYIWANRRKLNVSTSFRRRFPNSESIVLIIYLCRWP